MLNVQAEPCFDPDGFLLPGFVWNEQLARELARSSGIAALTEDHWRVLEYLRAHYRDAHALPVVHTLCRELGLAEHCVEKLFGNDLKRAWRIAGLPNPGEEAKVYMGQKSTSDRL